MGGLLDTWVDGWSGAWVHKCMDGWLMDAWVDGEGGKRINR